MNMEPHELDLNTLKYVKFIFDIHSDHSASTHGYHSLCKLIEDVKIFNTESDGNQPDSENGKLPMPHVIQQRELLIKFANYCNSFNIENNNIYEEDVDNFLNQ